MKATGRATDIRCHEFRVGSRHAPPDRNRTSAGSRRPLSPALAALDLGGPAFRHAGVRVGGCHFRLDGLEPPPPADQRRRCHPRRLARLPSRQHRRNCPAPAAQPFTVAAPSPRTKRRLCRCTRWPGTRRFFRRGLVLGCARRTDVRSAGCIRDVRAGRCPHVLAMRTLEEGCDRLGRAARTSP